MEQNILKIEGIQNVVVTPNIKEGQVKSLTAHLIYDGDITERFKAVRMLKEQMRQYLPDYMIPKKIVFLDHIPMTSNGKADRKRLMGHVS